MPAHDTTPADFRLIVVPEREALPAGAAATLRMLVRVQAPDAPASAAREPLHLALVLDRSGSMAGRPLEEAKRCARAMIDRLAHDDRAALVVYDDDVACIAPLASAADKTPFHAALDGLAPGGSTDLHGGWRAGAEALAGSMAGSGVHRVILLSDGNANCGVTDLETITGACRDLARRGVSTSTYGVGDEFNETLMLAMAQAGGGNAYYGETAEDLAEPFVAEFELLSQLCARGLVLRVNAPAGLPVRVRNGYDAAGAAAWKLPDLAYAAEAWALVEIDVPAGDAIAGESTTLPVTFTLQAAGQGAPVFLMAGLPALARVSAAEFAALAPDPLVATRIAELDAADVLAEVRSLVGAQRWVEAQRKVAGARQRFAGQPWARSVLDAMARLIEQRHASRSSKQALYARAAMGRRLAGRDEPAFDRQEDAPSFLRRRAQQGKGRPQPE
ncbi:MAG TPA: VWA domain-containing protein [Casimicrobiaceae bacterium]|nr:VWA domain-containing protein [Casimicrobiaceae bacterium]